MNASVSQCPIEISTIASDRAHCFRSRCRAAVSEIRAIIDGACSAVRGLQLLTSGVLGCLMSFEAVLNQMMTFKNPRPQWMAAVSYKHLYQTMSIPDSWKDILSAFPGHQQQFLVS